MGGRKEAHTKRRRTHLVAREGGGDKVVGVRLGADRVGDEGGGEVEPEGERGRERRQCRDDGGHEPEHLAHADGDRLAGLHAQVDATGEGQARKDNRHERVWRLAQRAALRRLPVRRVENAALVVGRRRAEGVDQPRDRPELHRGLVVNRVGARLVGRRALARRVVHQGLDKVQQLLRVGRQRHDRLVAYDRADELRGDLRDGGGVGSWWWWCGGV